MIEDAKTSGSNRRELRRFGTIMAVALGIIGGLLLWRERGHYFWFLILSAAFFMLCTAFLGSSLSMPM